MSIRHALGYRLGWAGFALLLGGSSLVQFARHGQIDQLIAMAAWLLLALAWFLQPAVLTAKVSDVARLSRQQAVGPVWLRAVATFGGLALMTAALALRFVR